MLCSHWLILTLSSSVVHFFNNRSQPQYGSLAPTQALRGYGEKKRNKVGYLGDMRDGGKNGGYQMREEG